MCYLGNGLDISIVKNRIADGFNEKSSCFFCYCLFKIGRIFGINKGDVDAKFRKDGIELGIGSTIKVVGRHNVVACFCESNDRIENCGSARCDGNRGGASFKLGNPLLKSVGSRIHQSGVDIAKLLEGKKVSRMFGAFEKIGGCAIDRHSTRECCVNRLACVQGKRFKAIVF